MMIPNSGISFIRLALGAWMVLYMLSIAIAQEQPQQPAVEAPSTEAVTNEIPTAPAVEPGFDGLPIDNQKPVSVKILLPKSGETVTSSHVDVFFEIDNYILAKNGNRLHVIVDNNPPIQHFSPRKPLTLKNLSEGGHTVRVMAVQPDGITIKQPEAFAIIHFFVRKKDFQNFTNPDLPYLTVNLPANETIDLPANGRIWLDYIAHNTGKKEDRNFSVRYKLNNVEGNARDGKAVYWENLPPGRYDMVVDLVDRNNTPVVGVFNQVKRSFIIRPVQRAIILAPETPPTNTPPQG